MRSCDVIVIGASTGGVEALKQIVAKLPPTLACAVLIVMHVGRESYLKEILARYSKLPVVSGEDGQAICRGCIYVAPAGSHMRLRDSKIALDHGPRENRHRPAIDPLFRSAARIFRDRVAGIILSGALDDGAAGLFAIKSRGGVAIVQDPESAVCGSMPANAMRHTKTDYCVPLQKIPALITRLGGRRRSRKMEPVHVPGGNDKTVKKAKVPVGKRGGNQIPVSCPECHGPLFQQRNGDSSYYHCDVGHSFAPESLTECHTEALERALWIAVRTLRERIAIQRSLAMGAKSGVGTTPEERFTEMADNAERDVALLQEILERL